MREIPAAIFAIISLMPRLRNYEMTLARILPADLRINNNKNAKNL
jgi:hypothetical protein